MPKEYKIETKALHAGAVIDETTSRGVPLYRTSSYVFRDTKHAADLFSLKELGNIYTRLMNPTQDVLEKRMAELEGGAGALALASGTSAIFYTIINICSNGDEFVAANNLYGGTYTMFKNILPGFGIKSHFVNPLEPDNFEKSINDKTKLIFTETIGNPVLDVANIKEISKIAKKHHLPLIVDSTFTTPYLYRPIEDGADIVVHSLTKWLGGHGTGIGGIVIPENYHAEKLLRDHGIVCKTKEEAQKEDIRSIRIGILNIMPQAETYEFNLLYPLGRSILQVEPVWIRLKTHNYYSTEDSHLENFYVFFEEAVSEKKLDGLILTGAPVEDIPFHEVIFWDEICEIIKYAEENIASTLGICWGGLAFAKFMGVEKEVYRKKIFGVFETRNLYPHHKIVGGLDDLFWCPFSSFSSLPDKPMEDKRDEGKINLLAHSVEAGYIIFESVDHKFIAHLGHPEYPAERLVYEYQRDVKKGREDVEVPKNQDIDNPLNRWRGHCLDFFAQWIKHIHETTSS